LRRPADLERQPGDHEALIGLTAGVEDIPEVVMAEGLD